MAALAPQELAGGGLAPALRDWAERRSRAGTATVVEGDLPRADPALEAEAFDLVTGAAALLPSGETAGPLLIALRADRERRIMTLDAGPASGTTSAPAELAGGPALASLRRVAGRLGGSVNVDEGGGAGTRIVIDLPATGTGGDDSGEQRGEP
jgi:signal transduction histidine kinase